MKHETRTIARNGTQLRQTPFDDKKRKKKRGDFTFLANLMLNLVSDEFFISLKYTDRKDLRGI